jgi:hypothetical protein
MKCCVLLSFSHVILASHDSFGYHGCTLVRSLSCVVSPSLDFVFRCPIMQFHFWALPPCNFVLGIAIVRLFVIFSYRGEKHHPRLRPSGWCLRHPDGLVCFLRHVSELGVLCFLEVSLFSSEIFFSPLCFMGTSFFIGSLLLIPLRFRGASFFVGYFFLSPLCFKGASFFIGCLFL